MLLLKLANSFSSSLVRYELGPGFFPCFTPPEILSAKVDFATPCSSAALFVPISPDFTASMAAIIKFLPHSLHFFLEVFEPESSALAFSLFLVFQLCLAASHWPHVFGMFTNEKEHNGIFQLFK